jgi:hypothetical protein
MVGQHPPACHLNNIHRSRAKTTNMRLINCSNYQLQEFFGSNTPPYAILSHTWETEEVTFANLTNDPVAAVSKKGWRKIQLTCKQAKLDGLNYAWVDTCVHNNRIMVCSNERTGVASTRVQAQSSPRLSTPCSPGTSLRCSVMSISPMLSRLS